MNYFHKTISLEGKQHAPDAAGCVTKTPIAYIVNIYACFVCRCVYTNVGDNQKKEKRAAEKSNTIEIPSQVLLAILYF